MSAPKVLDRITSMTFLRGDDYPQLLKDIEAELESPQLNTLKRVLTFLEKCPFFNDHVPFCKQILPYIEQGLKEGKLDGVKTNALMKRFVKEGVFKEFDRTGISNVQLLKSEKDSEKVSVAWLPLQTHSLFAQMLAKRLQSVEPKPDSPLAIDLDLSVEARQILKDFIEKNVMPARPYKTSVILELCRWERSAEKVGFVEFFSNIFKRGLEERFLWKGDEYHPFCSLMVGEENAKEALRALFDLTTVQNTLDCMALATLVGRSWYDTSNRDRVLMPLVRILVDFASEEGLLATNQVLANCKMVAEHMEEKELNEQAATLRRQVLAIQVKALKLYGENKDAQIDKQSVKGCTEEVINHFFMLYENLVHFDEKLLQEYREACVHNILRDYKINTYTDLGDEEEVSAGVEILPCMQKDTLLGAYLRKRFHSLVFTEGRGVQFVEGLKLAKLLQYPSPIALACTRNTKVYVLKKLEPAVKELMELAPPLQGVTWVVCDEIKEGPVTKDKPPQEDARIDPVTVLMSQVALIGQVASLLSRREEASVLPEDAEPIDAVLSQLLGEQEAEWLLHTVERREWDRKWELERENKRLADERWRAEFDSSRREAGVRKSEFKLFDSD